MCSGEGLGEEVCSGEGLGEEVCSEGLEEEV